MLMIQTYLYLKETWNLLIANEYMFKLCTWFTANKLSLNTDKTCFMAFSTQK